MPEDAQGPWRRTTLLGCSGAAVVGAVLSVVATIRVIDEAIFDEQVHAVPMAIAGLALATVGAVRWVTIGARAVSERRHTLVAALGQLPDTRLARPTETEGDRLVAGPGLRRYHRADCPMVAGRTWRGAREPVHEAAGRLPCGICLGSDQPVELPEASGAAA